MTRTPLLLDVDTGTDDAAALLWAVTSGRSDLVAATVTFGNCDVTTCAANTRRVLEAADSAAPVHVGAVGPAGPAPSLPSPAVVMGSDALGDLGLPAPRRAPSSELAPQAIVDAACRRPGELVVVALGPLTNLARAVALEPLLPRLLGGLVVLGGAFEGGNVTAAAEANIANDPQSAAEVVAAFGTPGAMASAPRLVPLDVVNRATLSLDDLDVLGASRVPGAALLHRVLSKVWPMATMETGGESILLADLIAAYLALTPSSATWELLPLAVDTGGSAAWGATIVDRRVALVETAIPDPDLRETVMASMGVPAARWSVATDIDTSLTLHDLREWLTGSR